MMGGCLLLSAHVHADDYARVQEFGLLVRKNPMEPRRSESD